MPPLTETEPDRPNRGAARKRAPSEVPVAAEAADPVHKEMALLEAMKDGPL